MDVKFKINLFKISLFLFSLSAVFLILIFNHYLSFKNIYTHFDKNINPNKIIINSNSKINFEDGDVLGLYNQNFNHFELSGWIAGFDYNNGKKSFYNNHISFNSINPVFYGIDANGNIIIRNNARDQELINFAKNNSIKIYPMIGSYDSNSLSLILESQIKTNEHINFIINEVNTYQYDGIELDYEKINLKNKNQYLDFIKNLYLKLNQNNKKLILTLMPKTNDNNSDETLQSQDWKILSEYADELKIMAYDYPGSVSPLDWTNEILHYASTKIPKSKINLALPFFGYGYSSTTKEAYTYQQIQNLIANNNLIINIDEITKQKYFDYFKNNQNFQVWFFDNEVLKMRLELAQKYGINKISMWRMGGEDIEFYKNFN